MCICARGCVRVAAYCQAYLYSSPGHSSSHLAVHGLCPSRGLCSNHQKSVCGPIIKSGAEPGSERVSGFVAFQLWELTQVFRQLREDLHSNSYCKIDYVSNYTCPPGGWRDGCMDGWRDEATER